MVEQVEQKRLRGGNASQVEQASKRRRLDSSLDVLSDTAATASKVNSETSKSGPSLQPFPYFYYCDHSRVEDPDPFKPLTAPGRVPNFPAKMMAILSRPEYSDIVTWLDHGRAWKVLKSHQFETEVIPKFFEHAKFSSFIRQANGWGFRRITQGKDRNAYYNELFLRGLPHLCKQMKRHGVSEKQSADPDHEPDFYKISEEHPLPVEGPDDESILLPHILTEGPKARMPVFFHRKKTTRPVSPDVSKTVLNSQTFAGSPSLLSYTTHPHSPSMLPAASIAPRAMPVHPVGFPMSQDNHIMTSLLASRNGHKDHAPARISPLLQSSVGHQMTGLPITPNLAQLDPSTQYAAGFAAAAAMTQAHFRSILGHALASIPPTVPK
ncbi:unnamed protein product [Cylindrotheca closterium]|uniref:HSF-type DNA-binding domain-containing protein n=1 Tax=Cylindrotheca closterium TaxID=2856 RepID=A0AAD2CIT3_9STRA|nr:unnamed protein product [Cylindrotheca closterium]